MVFDTSGNIAGSHYIEYDLIFTPEGVEQDAELWWEYAKTALLEAIRSAGIKGSELKGLGVASQGIASVPINIEGKPLAHAISWYDARAQQEACQMADEYGAGFLLQATGRKPGSLFFPQVLHIKRAYPALYEKARFFLMAQDYLVYRFCGQAVMDYTLASGTLCFDTLEHKWMGELFDRYGIDMSEFPALKPFGSKAGELLPQVARELGLGEDTVVAVGMQDQKAAALGAGITAQKGIMTLSLGTASAVSRLSAKKRTDPKGRVFCHAFDGQSWIMENYLGSSGSSLKWLRKTLFPQLSYAELDALAEKSGAGSGGVVFIPALEEKQGGFSGLSLNTAPGDLARAVLEGIAYGIRRCVEIQKAFSYNEEKAEWELRVFGGGSGSRLWCQILADVLAMPVVLPRTGECSNVGAAICAGLALGLFSGDAELAEFIGGPRLKFMPDTAHAGTYEEGYRRFCSLYEL